MKRAQRKYWKSNALGASFLVLTAVAGCSNIDTGTQEPTVQIDATSPEPSSETVQITEQPLDEVGTNPGTIEHVPTQSAESEQTQPNVTVEGSDYYDGQYYGDAVSADQWGTVQVVAVIENGVLIDVLIADYPHSNYESTIINRVALHALISEAIEAQDAEVDIISRATDSSIAFVQSLDSALLDAAIGMDFQNNSAG
ncbi:MAG: hypothetical protein IPO91_13550 [Chloroflexi bacterium]|nr:hypothetical protein [Chloroflexota bacterium]